MTTEAALNPSDPAFQAQFVEDMRNLEGVTKYVHLTLSPGEVLTVIAQMQLALRHPGNTGTSANLARSIIDHLIGIVGVTPTLRAGLEAGYDPAQDTPAPAREESTP